MVNPVVRLLVNIGRLAAAFGICFLFFIAFSMLHAMIDVGKKDDDKSKKAHKVLIEMVRKPPEEELKKAIPKVRKVTSSDDDKSLKNKLTMKLVPDLSVDAGVGGDGAGVVHVDTQDLQAEVFEEGETDERPIPLQTTPVDYPLEARERGVEVLCYVCRLRRDSISLDSPLPIAL